MSERGDADTVELSLPARPASLELVHTAVEELWQGDDSVAVGDRMRFEMAVVEIFANIVEHAYGKDPEPLEESARRFHLRLAVTEEQVTAHFSDNGLPVELDLSDVVLPDAEAESGRGLAMAMAALDDLAYHHADGRNHWSLVCRRQRP